MTAPAKSDGIPQRPAGIRSRISRCFRELRNATLSCRVRDNIYFPLKRKHGCDVDNLSTGRSSMCLPAARHRRKTLDRLTSMTESQFSSLWSAAGCRRMILTLLTRMSRRPNRSTVVEDEPVEATGSSRFASALECSATSAPAPTSANLKPCWMNSPHKWTNWGSSNA